MNFFLLFFIFIFFCQQSFGFRLPSPLNFYNYDRRISAQEPITESPNFYDDAQVQRILKTINDGLQEFKNIPIDFTKEIVDVNSLLSKLPKLSISRIAHIP